jgi:polyferredoxin
MAKEDDLSNKERKEVIKEINKKLKEKVVSNAAELKNEFKKQTSTAIMAAFGLIIALSWKDVITDWVNTLGFVKSYGLLVTALVLTLVSVLGILLISKWAKTSEEKK